MTPVRRLTGSDPSNCGHVKERAEWRAALPDLIQYILFKRGRCPWLPSDAPTVNHGLGSTWGEAERSNTQFVAKSNIHRNASHLWGESRPSFSI